MNSNKCTNNDLNTLLIVHSKERLLIGSTFPLTIKVLMIKAMNSDCNLFHKTITKETALEILQTLIKSQFKSSQVFNIYILSDSKINKIANTLKNPHLAF